MSDIIHLLPDSIANQIAAGEVIQRPASAVKELMENAVDAGATEIRLIIKDAGKTLIQVIDNGKGMSATDARMCFERHATSKISKADDLFSIRTMGFRGEALASIAAIAQVELKTRTPGTELGTRIVIEGFEFKSQEQCQCAIGTSVSVKNLFYNVPARRNFLKSNTVELKHIIDEFERVALAFPDLFFSMHHNNIELFHLKSGNLRQRIVQLFGNQYNEKLVPIEENTSVSHIRGFIGKPDSAKKTKGEQFFFVNNRFIRSPYLHHAIMSMYEGLIQENSFPLYTIFIDIDPSRIDVNVHPTKQEIKFEDDRIIYTFMQAAVRHALAQYSITPTLDFEQDPTFANLPQFYNKNRKEEEKQAVSFKTFGSKINEFPPLPGIQKFPTREEIGALDTDPLSKQTKAFQSSGDTETGAAFQVHNQYLITQIRSGIVIIDQQAAHERVLYEKYLARLEGKKHFTQQQLFPKSIELSVNDAALLNELIPAMNQIGFDIQHFGKQTFIVHGIPSEFEFVDEKAVIENVLEQFKEDKNALQLSKHETIAKSLARHHSIKKGQPLDEKGIHNLIDELFACSTPYISPSGTLTFATFTLDDLSMMMQKK